MQSRRVPVERLFIMQPRSCLLLFLLALVACTPTADPRSRVQSSQGIVVRDSARAFTACRPERIVEQIEQLFVAYSEGDAEKAASFVSSGTHWFTFTRPPERGGHRDFGSPALMRAYIAERHAHGERLRLEQLRLNGPGGGAGNDAMNVDYDFTWSADDGSGRGAGKGAIDCDGHVIAWSMAEQ